MIDGTFCQVDAGQAAAGLREQLMVRTEADADLQHVPVPRLGCVGKRGNERLELVTAPAVREVARSVPAVKVEIFAAGRCVPEVVNAAKGIRRSDRGHCQKPTADRGRARAWPILAGAGSRKCRHQISMHISPRMV